MTMSTRYRPRLGWQRQDDVAREIGDRDLAAAPHQGAQAQRRHHQRDQRCGQQRAQDQPAEGQETIDEERDEKVTMAKTGCGDYSPRMTADDRITLEASR
jgi:hypothetical protein